MRATAILLFVASLGSAPGTAASVQTESEFIRYSGEAVSSSGQFLYSEQHVLKYRDGRLRARAVLYTCKDGAPFARKLASYNDPLAPDFLLEDSTNGMLQGVRSSGAVRTVFFRNGREEPEKAAELAIPAGGVIDAGFDEFIRANWDSLMSGRAIAMQFVVPSRLSGMSFQVQHVRSAQEAIATEVFRLKISGVLGLVFPGIDVYYSADQHVLVRYEGLSDLRDRSGENVRATITFRPEDRRVADAQAFDSASQATLAPCKG